MGVLSIVMSRHVRRTYRVCPHCGSGFDAFKAMDARGRYCSPACLEEARVSRGHHATDQLGLTGFPGDRGSGPLRGMA